MLIKINIFWMGNLRPGNLQQFLFGVVKHVFKGIVKLDPASVVETDPAYTYRSLLKYCVVFTFTLTERLTNSGMFKIPILFAEK